MGKRRLNITIDEDMFIAFKMDVRSASAVINNLLKDQFLQANRDKLIAVVTQQVKDALTADQSWLDELRYTGNTKQLNVVPPVKLNGEGTAFGLGDYPQAIAVPPCCLAKSPCKHWAWDGMRGGHVNTISGEFREA